MRNLISLIVLENMVLSEFLLNIQKHNVSVSLEINGAGLLPNKYTWSFSSKIFFM